MLGSSGRGGVEGGGVFQFNLATQDPLRGLGERALNFDPPGLLEQGADPGRTAAHHRGQHASAAGRNRNRQGGLADIRFLAKLPPAALYGRLRHQLARARRARLDHCGPQ